MAAIWTGRTGLANLSRNHSIVRPSDEPLVCGARCDTVPPALCDASGPFHAALANLDYAEATISKVNQGNGLKLSGTLKLRKSLTAPPAGMCSVLHSAYPLPVGAWLLTGTSIVPDPPYTATQGDLVTISIEGLGTLTNRVVSVPHSGATAPPRIP